MLYKKNDLYIVKFNQDTQLYIANSGEYLTLITQGKNVDKSCNWKYELSSVYDNLPPIISKIGIERREKELNQIYSNLERTR